MLPEEYQVHYMLPEEQEAIKALKSEDKIVSEFYSLWSRWKNWEKFPPIVLVHNDDGIVGFHAHTTTKSRYINSMYQFVHSDHRGLRLGGAMVDFMLRENPDAERLKMRCPNESDGLAFWTGFGLSFVGEIEKEVFFDVSLYDIASLDDLMDFAWELNDEVTEDKRTLNHYKKLGVVFVDPAWEHLNE